MGDDKMSGRVSDGGIHPGPSPPGPSQTERPNAREGLELDDNYKGLYS